MGSQEKTIAEAWAIHQRLRAARPAGLRARARGDRDLGLVTFDRDFTRFPALDLTLLDDR